MACNSPGVKRRASVNVAATICADSTGASTIVPQPGATSYKGIVDRNAVGGFRGASFSGAGGAHEHATPGSPHGPSVCMVLCYFGPPPGWIEHFLLSCSYNPSIDFLIFTDHAAFPAVPPNVCVMQLNMASFDALATKTIGVEVKLSHPRKLCDFKPAYGHLFEEHLNGLGLLGIRRHGRHLRRSPQVSFSFQAAGARCL